MLIYPFLNAGTLEKYNESIAMIQKSTAEDNLRSQSIITLLKETFTRRRQDIIKMNAKKEDMVQTISAKWTCFKRGEFVRELLI